jgi:hypothetical protein
VVGAAVVANIYTIANCLISLAFSQRKHLQRAVAKADAVKSEGYLQVRVTRLGEFSTLGRLFTLAIFSSLCVKAFILYKRASYLTLCTHDR